jgi:PAS domain S-box-containing protein
MGVAAQFRPSNDFMIELMAAIKFGIVIADLEGRVAYLNPYALDLFGYREEEIVSQPVSRLFLADDVGVFLPNILQLTRSQNGFEGEILLRGARGDTIWSWLSTILYHDPRDQDLIIMVVTDISRLKDLEHRHREDQRFALLGRFTDRIAHHLRNPVMSLGGFARRLLSRPDMDPAQRENYLAVIAQEAKRIEAVVEQAGAYARLPAPQVEPVELGSIIDRSLEENRRRNPRARGIECTVTVPEELRGVTSRVDLELMVTSLSNVLDNALDAVREAVARGLDGARRVELGAAVEDNRLVLRVTDTGCGVADEDAAFVFDPFFTTKPDHVGMGLTISKRIIEEHGGRIEFESGPGAGSVFRLITPLERRRTVRVRLV